jgi:transcriptional regulator with XRE-family HTH domain
MANYKSDDLDKVVAKRLKSQRTFTGVTLKQLSEGLGVSVSQIQKYENGQNRISASMLFRISKILKVPMEYFFGETDLFS